MSTFVVLDGTGTYTVNGTQFRSGRTECDDEATLDAVRAEGLDWLYVEEVDEVPEGTDADSIAARPQPAGPLTLSDVKSGAPGCDECERTFGTTRELELHKTIAHPPVPPESENPDTAPESENPDETEEDISRLENEGGPPVPPDDDLAGGNGGGEVV